MQRRNVSTFGFVTYHSKLELDAHAELCLHRLLV